MGSPKKEKSSIKKFWTRLIQKMQPLAGKGKRLFLNLASPLKKLREKFLHWPRLVQAGSIYLIVLILAGGIFVWRSAQLRTINPYVEKLRFPELENDYLLEHENDVKNQDQEKQGEPVSASPVPLPADPGETPLSPPKRWPLQGGELVYGYKDILATESCMAISSSHIYLGGIGIKALPAEKVHSISEGTVKAILDPGFPYGKMVVIEHADNLKVYYGALDQVYVKKGDQVALDEFIATVGKNREGKETYLYLEMQEDGRPVNPLDILPAL